MKQLAYSKSQPLIRACLNFYFCGITTHCTCHVGAIVVVFLMVSIRMVIRGIYKKVKTSFMDLGVDFLCN